MQAKTVHFTKMHGAGNDYVYIDGVTEPIERIGRPEELAVRISDRHFGVGSDGLVLILPSQTGDVRMRMFNANGSEAEMCGNASRCVGKFAYDHGLVRNDVIRLETAAGLKIITLRKEDGQVTGACVDMGEPILEPAAIPVDTAWASAPRCVGQPLEIAGVTYAVTCVSMGNPHAVVFVEDVDALDLPRIGPLFENNPVFPSRINTEFVQVVSESRVRMRVWERGSGETLACGTGACATCVACVLNGRTGREITVSLLGGDLVTNWSAADSHVYMTGNAVTVFEGDFLL